MSKVGFMPEVPQGLLGGLTGGLTFRYTCEKYFKSICAIVAEVNLAQTGWKEDIVDVDRLPVYYTDDPDKLNPLFYERKMTYVQIPLMARMGWGRERKGFQFFFQVGPQIGMFLSESTSTNVVKGKPTQNARTSTIVAQDSMAVEKKFESDVTDMSLMVALLQGYIDIASMEEVSLDKVEVDWDIVTMLPPSDIENGAEKMAEKIKAIKEIDFKMPLLKKDVNIVNVRIYAEGFCAYVGMMCDMNRHVRPQYRSLRDETNIIFKTPEKGSTQHADLQRNRAAQKSAAAQTG